MFITFLFVVFLLVIFFSIHIKKLSLESESYDFLNKDFTTQVRGIAIFIIMIGHLIGYIYLYPNFSIPYVHEQVIKFIMDRFILIAVGSFLFLSGYGNWLSIKKQENKNKWIVNKLVKLYIPVGILVFISYFLAYALNLQILFPYWWTAFWNFFILSVVMWSYWYLKVQAMSYTFLFISVKHFKSYALLILSIIFLFYFIVLAYIGVEYKWYISCLCFPFGAIVAEYKKSISDKFKNKIMVLLDFFIISLLILMSFIFRQNKIEFILIIIAMLILACLIMIKLSNIFDLKSKLLKFMGEYSLELYLLHLVLVPFVRNYGNVHNRVINIFSYFFVFILSLIFAPILRYLSDKIINTLKGKIE